MKVGIRFANADWRADPAGAARFARLAEEAGVESLWAIDRVALPWRYESRYPYHPSGRLPEYFHGLSIAEPFTWLTWVAAHTRNIRLGTGVLVLPLRPAAVVAKQAATLDVLSGGRALLGVGAGWLREEFAAVGADFANRHEVLVERIAAMRALWASAHASHDGAVERFDDVEAAPRPIRAAVPIVVGGGGRAAAIRAGQLGDGYYPARGTPAEVGALVSVMRRAAARAGRDPDAIEVTCGTEPEPALMVEYRRAGVHRVLVAPPGRDPDGFVRGVSDLATLVGRAESMEIDR